MPRFTTHHRCHQIALGAALSVLLAGCSLPGWLSFPEQVRGNKIDPDQLSQLVPGTSTRQDATALLGSPTAHATFDDNTWIYISEVTKPLIGGFQGVEDQHVTVLTFDGKGVLTGIQKKDQADSLPVNVVSRTTPSPGSNATFLQQLLGNVGRFNPTPTQSSGPGATVGPGSY
jgi:outer membrane protein assembly factor BamE (lipoprotein component of BamABCDE complex)